MTPLMNCSCVLRSTLESVNLVFMCVSIESLVCAFIYKRRYLFVINTLTFALQFAVTQIMMAVSEQLFYQRGGTAALYLAGYPVFLYMVIIIISFVLSLLSFLWFCRQQNIRQYVVNPLRIKSEHLLLHKKAEKLQNDQIKLEEMNYQMRIYGEEMQEQIKQREILQAKVNIHNGMNQLILMTVNAVNSQNETEIKQVISLWQRDALLLCKTSDAKPTDNIVKDIEALAANLGVTLEWNAIPEFTDERLCTLFFKASCEALMNAVKHAGATYVRMVAVENRFLFSNNGVIPNENIVPAGGLATVEKLAWEMGYTMTVKCDSEFHLIFTKKEIK